jgi:hypothetical protein
MQHIPHRITGEVNNAQRLPPQPDLGRSGATDAVAQNSFP